MSINKNAEILRHTGVAPTEGETNESATRGSLPFGETILRVTIVVREGSTATQLAFAPRTKFEAGAAAVDRALASLQAERDESRTCPAWKDSFAMGTER